MTPAHIHHGFQAYRSGVPPGGLDSSTPGDASMYLTHEINLLDTFAEGDLMFIRFRLHADPLAVAWGWGHRQHRDPT